MEKENVVRKPSLAPTNFFRHPDQGLNPGSDETYSERSLSKGLDHSAIRAGPYSKVRLSAKAAFYKKCQIIYTITFYV